MGRLRRLWRDVHLWIGAGLLLAFIPLSLTGSILVWHDPLDRALAAERYAVSGVEVAQPIAAYARAAQAAFGDRAILTQVRLPSRAGDPVVAVGRMAGPPGPGGRPRSLNAWIDPPTARVLATADLSQGLTMTLHRLHGTLLIPEVGRKVVGWLGWAMFVSAATGLWLWWPRGGGLLRGLRWRRGPSTLFNLHHTLGFWISAPLAVLSLTGVYISFPQTSRALFGLPPPPARTANAVRFAPPIPPRLDMEQALALASAAAPGAAIAEVNLPTKSPQPVWRMSFRTKGAATLRVVQVVDATGALKADSPRNAEPASRDTVSPLMRRIHDGAGMGLVWQIVIFTGGLAAPVLGVTGVVLWLRRRSRRRDVLAGAA